MLVFRRTLYQRFQKLPEALLSFQTMVQTLRSMAVEVGYQEAANDSSQWPNAEWSTQSHEIKCSEWMPQSAHLPRLLDLRFAEHWDDALWELDLHLACTESTSLIISEEWRINVLRRRIDFEALSHRFSLLDRYQGGLINEDGRSASEWLMLRSDRVRAFLDFLHSPERRLPVVLLSFNPQADQFPQLKSLSNFSKGMATFVRTEDLAGERKLSELLSSHRCWGGAIRVYMPGFDVADKAWLHPFWLPSVDPEEIIQEITDRLARESVSLEANRTIDSLVRQREEHLRRESERARLELLRQRNDREAAETEAKNLFEEYSKLDARVESLTAEKDRLLQENNSLQDQIRGLKWRIQGAFQETEAEPDEEPRPRIFLSEQASARYRALDAGERDYWSRTLLPKLLEKQLRQRQSEPVRSRGRTCFVYPRSRTADGRRLIYYCDGEDTYVCEIYTTAEHDREYEELRDRGIDQEEYSNGGFEAWQPY